MSYRRGFVPSVILNSNNSLSRFLRPFLLRKKNGGLVFIFGAAWACVLRKPKAVLFLRWSFNIYVISETGLPPQASWIHALGSRNFPLLLEIVLFSTFYSD